MADRHQIRRVFGGLGELYAAEHSEHDDEGARMVQGLVRRLRKFSLHEQAEQERLAADPFRRGVLEAARTREATYGEGGTKVYYDAGDAIRDVTDLYTVLEENHTTGSPNLENMQARGLLERLQLGGGLGEAQIGVMRKLMAKHAPAIDALRISHDRQGQDLLELPDAGASARIIAKKGAGQ